MTGWFASLGRNKGLKLLAVLLAICLWFAVGGEQRTETTLILPLELVKLPDNLAVIGEVPPAVQVRVNGPRSLVNNLAQARQSHALDLTGYKGGRHTFNLGPNSFTFPRGVTVTRIQPNSFSLNLAVTASRTLPIKPVLEGAPPEGYQVVEARTKPAQVTVKGPFQEIAALKAIPTLPIDLRDLTETTSVPTDLDFKNLHLTLKEPGLILAEIEIAPKALSRTITGVPVTAATAGARLNPAQVSVTVSGPWPLVKALKAADLKATVDTRNLPAGRHRLKVAVELPQGLALARLDPQMVTVQVAKSRF